MATKKSAPKKSLVKKAVPGKAAAKKSAKRKTKAKLKKAAPKIIIPQEFPDNVDCICIQKKPNGKFYNFKLQEGRWVQASAIPFPSKEICEDACC